ncbi:hypothetical protein ACFCXA_19410 [Streptomyces virginiae]|uniref:hypothetical protein n=1 Tax=Streptomyces virginiae TaxID=1961 RepID=UPI00324F838E
MVPRLWWPWIGGEGDAIERRRSAQRVAFASRNLHRFMTGRHPALRVALVRGAGAALHRVGERRWRASGT